MKINFSISDEVFGGYGFMFPVQWDCPHIPRKGDTVDDSILKPWIAPKKFREKLEDKTHWDNIVQEFITEHGCNEKEAQLGTLDIYFETIIFEVQEVVWPYDKTDGYYLNIYLGDDE